MGLLDSEYKPTAFLSAHSLFCALRRSRGGGALLHPPVIYVNYLQNFKPVQWSIWNSLRGWRNTHWLQREESSHSALCPYNYIIIAHKSLDCHSLTVTLFTRWKCAFPCWDAAQHCARCCLRARSITVSTALAVEQRSLMDAEIKSRTRTREA